MRRASHRGQWDANFEPFDGILSSYFKLRLVFANHPANPAKSRLTSVKLDE
jgi:hypothetical protein